MKVCSKFNYVIRINNELIRPAVKVTVKQDIFLQYRDSIQLIDTVYTQHIQHIHTGTYTLTHTVLNRDNNKSDTLCVALQ